ncbi:hypothetical protein [Pimelobacter simplex]
MSRVTRCSSTWSRVISGPNRMIAVFSLEMKSRLFFEIAAMSSCRLIAQ